MAQVPSRYIPHLRNWLDRGGWKDVLAGELVPVSHEEMRATEARNATSGRDYEYRMQQLSEAQRRKQLGPVE